MNEQELNYRRSEIFMQIERLERIWCSYCDDLYSAGYADHFNALAAKDVMKHARRLLAHGVNCAPQLRSNLPKSNPENSPATPADEQV